MGELIARTRSSPGFALVIVLWSVAVLALLGLALTGGAREQLAAAAAVRDRAIAEEAAAGALRQGVFLALAGDFGLAEGRPARVVIGGIPAVVAAEDEGARLNPNTASPAALQGLLSALGADPPLAARLAGEIVDWRGGQQASVLVGTKLDAYRASHLPYGPAGRPFESVDEIALLPGMPPALAARLMPWLTVYYQDVTRTLDPASPVGAALGRGAMADPAAAPPLIPDRARILRFTASVATRGGARFTRRTVVRVFSEPGPNGTLYQVLTWD